MDKVDLAASKKLCRKHMLAAMKLELARELERESKHASSSRCKSHRCKVHLHDDCEESFARKPCTKRTTKASDCKEFYSHSPSPPPHSKNSCSKKIEPNFHTNVFSSDEELPCTSRQSAQPNVTCKKNQHRGDKHVECKNKKNEKHYKNVSQKEFLNERSACKIPSLRLYSGRNPSLGLSALRLSSRKDVAMGLPSLRPSSRKESSIKLPSLRRSSRKNTPLDLSSLRLLAWKQSSLGLPSLGLSPNKELSIELPTLELSSSRQSSMGLPSLGLSSRKNPSLGLPSLGLSSRNITPKKSLHDSSSDATPRCPFASDLGESFADSSQRKIPTGRLSPPTPPIWDLSSASDSSERDVKARPSQMSREDLITVKMVIPLHRRIRHLFKTNLQNKLELMEELEALPAKINAVFERVKREQEEEKKKAKSQAKKKKKEQQMGHGFN